MRDSSTHAKTSVNLGLLPRAAAERFGDRLALIDVESATPRQFTFAELADRCDRIGRALLARGMKSGARAMVVGRNQIEFVEAIFGTLRAGLVAIPVDERIGARAIESIGARCQPKAVIATGDNPAMPSVTAPIQISARPRAGWDSYHSVFAERDGAQSDISLPGDFSIDAPAIIIHTSGSTGLPKGVVLSHRAATSGLRLHRREGAIKDIRQRSLLSLPLGHQAAFSALKYMLAYGGTTILGPPFRAPEFLQALAEHRCIHTLMVPAMAILVLKESELLRRLDFSALQSIVIGSAACSSDLLRAMTEAFPAAVITQNYGLTECGQVFAQSYTRNGRAPFASVGKPVKGVEVRLEDGDEGELWVKTPAMMSGLDEGATIKTDATDGWFRTGDVFSKDANGYFYYRGRKDEMISSGGTNVFPAEVEEVLCQHPAVLGACVVALSHPVKGEAPAAMVVLRPGAMLTAEALTAFYLTQGAPYARPRFISFVDEMPVAATGKIDRAAVRKTMASGAIAETRARQTCEPS